MGNIRKLLSSPFVSVSLIIICIYTLFTYSNALKQEQGRRVENQIRDTKILVNVIESKLEMHGPSSIDEDTLQYVNHLVHINSRGMIWFEMLLEDYQKLLRRINEGNELEREQLVEVARAFHLDIKDVLSYAYSKGDSGDSTGYAKLIDNSSKVAKEFNKLIEQKVEKNRARLASINF